MIAGLYKVSRRCQLSGIEAQAYRFCGETPPAIAGGFQARTPTPMAPGPRTPPAVLEALTRGAGAGIWSAARFRSSAADPERPLASATVCRPTAAICSRASSRLVGLSLVHPDIRMFGPLPLEPLLVRRPCGFKEGDQGADLCRAQDPPKGGHGDIGRGKIGPSVPLDNRLGQNAIRMMPGMAILVEGRGKATSPHFAVAVDAMLLI